MHDSQRAGTAPPQTETLRQTPLSIKHGKRTKKPKPEEDHHSKHRSRLKASMSGYARWWQNFIPEGYGLYHQQWRNGKTFGSLSRMSQSPLVGCQIHTVPTYLLVR